MKNQRIFCLSLVIIMSMMLSGCGFHLRQAKDFPKSLHTLYINNQHNSSLFSSELKSLLRSVNVNLVKQAKQAPITLHIIQTRFSHSQPNISSNLLPTNYVYYFTVELALTKKSAKKPFAIATLQTDQVVTLTGNQVLIPDTAMPIKRTLIQQMLNRVYYWLVIQG